jgi:putative acetyltransferase
MEEADFAALTAIRNCPGVRWGTLSLPYESERRMRALYGALPDPKDRHLVACVDGVVVGSASLSGAPGLRRAHVGSVGIMVRDGWTGRGIGTRLFAALIDLADNWLNLKRLELEVFTDNHAAIALYKRFGFTVEGTRRAEAFRDGAYVNGYLMARLRADAALPE